MSRRGRPRHPDILTPREWEVLALLREGLSNPEIAERMGISRDGVKFHVSEILTKLGVASREEAASWSVAEIRRPWWMSALAPLGLLWRKTGWAIGGALLVGAAGGLGLLAVLLMRSGGGGGKESLSNTDVISIPDIGILTDTSLQIDRSGNPVISYVEVPNGWLKVLHCGNPTCTAKNSISMADSDAESGRTSLALDPKGNPVVSYPGNDGRLRVLHCGNADCSADNSIATPEAGRATGLHSSLVLDQQGYPVVSYYDAVNYDLKVLHCGNRDCSAGNTIASPDTVGDVGSYSSVAIDSAGNPVVAYQGNGLKVLHCGDRACQNNNSISAPDVGGYYISVALDQRGNPVISYWGSSSHLTVLRCGDPNCAAQNSIAEADRAGDVGNFSSLELDPAGDPVVSYVDNSSGRLKILHCGRFDCMAANTITVPDRSLGLQYTSLALDGRGNPVVAYADGVNRQLKVLHCGDTSCNSAAATASALSTADAPTEAVRNNIAYTGTPEVDSVIAMIRQRRFDDLTQLVLFTKGSCETSSATCVSGESGSASPAFYSGCAKPYPTALDDVTTLIARTFNEHAAWSVYAVAEDGLPGAGRDGYVVDVRGATGNAGVTFYLTREGRLVGFDPCAMDVDPALRYLYGPSLTEPTPRAEP